jgi:hypothetical protein
LPRGGVLLIATLSSRSAQQHMGSGESVFVCEHRHELGKNRFHIEAQMIGRGVTSDRKSDAQQSR